MSDQPKKAPVGDGGGPRPKTREDDRRGTAPRNENGQQVAFVPTPEQRIEVQTLASCFVEMEHIAVRLGISETTVRKYFAKEIAEGRANTLSSVSAKMVKSALDGDTKAMRIILEKKGGWNTTIQHTGANGGPIEFRNLSESEVDAQIAELIQKNGQGSDAIH